MKFGKQKWRSHDSLFCTTRRQRCMGTRWALSTAHGPNSWPCPCGTDSQQAHASCCLLGTSFSSLFQKTPPEGPFCFQVHTGPCTFLQLFGVPRTSASCHTEQCLSSCDPTDCQHFQLHDLSSKHLVLRVDLSPASTLTDSMLQPQTQSTSLVALLRGYIGLVLFIFR